MLIHVVDVSGSEGRDPEEDFDSINKELKSYSEILGKKPQIIAANKTDILQDDILLNKFTKAMEKRGYEVFKISAVTGDGLRKLMGRAAEIIEEIPVPRLIINNLKEKVYTVEREEPFTIRVEEGVYILEGNWVKWLMGSVNIQDEESLQFFQRSLKQKGVIAKLEEMNIQKDDIVRIDDYEFEYIE